MAPIVFRHSRKRNFLDEAIHKQSSGTKIWYKGKHVEKASIDFSKHYMPYSKKRKHTSGLSIGSQKAKHSAGKRKSGNRKFAKAGKPSKPYKGTKAVAVWESKNAQAKNISNKIIEVDHGESSSKTSLIKHHKREKGVKLLQNKCIFEQIDSNVLNSTTGRQGVLTINGAVPNAGVLGTNIGAGFVMCGAASGDIANLIGQAEQFFNNTSGLAVTEAPFGAAAGAVLTSSQKFFLDYVRVVYEFVNASPVQTELVLYELQAKVTTPSFTDPVTDWSSGLSKEGGVSNFVSQLTPNASPTASKQFNMAWRIIGKHRVSLAPGRIHKHVFTHKVNLIIDTAYIKQYSLIRGLTTCMMVTMLGEPLSTGVVGNPVTESASKINYVMSEHLEGRALSIFPRIVEQINNLSTAIPTSQNIENEDSGAPIAVTNAVPAYINQA